MERQELTSAIIKYNRQVNEAVSSIQRSLKNLEEFRYSFADQRQLIARLDMTKRTLVAAANNLESLRPRIFMIEHDDAPLKKNKQNVKNQNS